MFLKVIKNNTLIETENNVKNLKCSIYKLRNVPYVIAILYKGWTRNRYPDVCYL